MILSVAQIEAICLVMMAAVNIFLAVILIRGLRAEEGIIERVASRTEYVIHELARLGRTIRTRAAPMTEGAEADEAEGVATVGALEVLQQEGFSEIGDAAIDAHALAGELVALKDKEFAAWRETNRERIERLLAGQAALHKRLEDAQAVLDASTQTIHNQRTQIERLLGAENKVKLLETANHGLEAEVSKMKNHAARVNAEASRVRLEAAAAKRELLEHETKMKELHEKYVRDREQLLTDKNVLEMRLNALQETFNRNVQEKDDSTALREAHAEFLREAEKLAEEKKTLEEQLAALQGDFDRTLVEKAFIESALLDMDSALRYSKNAIPGGAASRAMKPTAAA